MIKFKNILIIFLLPITSLLFYSCSEDVVSIDINSSAPKIVIEGKIVTGNGPQTVKITKTTDFFKPSDFPPVLGADVTITDTKGNAVTLDETGGGLYTTSKIQGIVGETYKLTVRTGEKVYSSLSTLKSPVVIDSLSMEEDSQGGGDKIYFLHCYFSDTKNLTEYYRLKIYINGEQYKDYGLYQDRLTDGKKIDYEYYINDEQYKDEFHDGDIITLEMEAIDRPVYDYFNTLSNALISMSDESSTPFSSTPGNPESNISNGALGYFSAYSSTAYTLIYKKK